MSMPSRAVTDTSVSVSLADLAKIEEERLQQEEADRARTREERARQEREATAKRHSEEMEAARATAEAAAQRSREEAIEKVRAEARERAASDVARIQAEARARLEVDNAARAHELAVLRAKRETGRRRREIALGVALAFVACLGGLGTYEASGRASKLERAGQELRDRERALGREHEDAKRTDLQALDRRHAALQARGFDRDAGEAKKTVEAARAAIDARSPSRDGLRTFADSLDALQSRIETLEKLSLLERRHADLAAWARAVRRTQAMQPVSDGAARARAPGAGSAAMVAYERALDTARARLAGDASSPGRPGASEPGPGSSTGTCRENDPGCGLDGKPVF